MRLSKLTILSLVAAVSLLFALSGQLQTILLELHTDSPGFSNKLQVYPPTSLFDSGTLRPGEFTYTTTYSNYDRSYDSPFSNKITVKPLSSDTSGAHFVYYYDVSEFASPSSHVVHFSSASILPDDSTCEITVANTTVFTCSGMTQGNIVSDFSIADQSHIQVSRYYFATAETSEAGARFIYDDLFEIVRPSSYAVNFFSPSILPDDSAFKNTVANTTLFSHSAITQREMVPTFSIANQSHIQLSPFSFPTAEISPITNSKPLASSSDFRFVNTTFGPTLTTSISDSGECDCFSGTPTSGKHPEIEPNIDGPTVTMGVSQIGSFN